MRKTRGFKLGRKVFNWVINGRTKRQLLKSPSCTTKALSKICNWVRNLKLGVKGHCFSKSKSGYIRVGDDPLETGKAVSVPKGKLAVYVGEKEEDTCRVLVPVIYFNHPLFGDLLRETREVYGFHHPGGIQIPCQISEFQKVQMRIAAAAAGDGGGGGGGACRWRQRWGRHYWLL